MGKWKKGVLSEDLTSIGGETIKKGETVNYIRKKVHPDNEGFTYGDYEYHYKKVGGGLIRSSKLIITINQSGESL